MQNSVCELVWMCADKTNHNILSDYFVYDFFFQYLCDETNKA